MPKLTCNIIGYLKIVFIESWQKVFTFFDVLGIVLFFYPNLADQFVKNVSWTRSLGGVIFFVSFLLANYMVYQGLCIEGADIRLKVDKQYFNSSSSGRFPFEEIQNSPHGFNKQGLPDWASLYAEIEIVNIGFEDGKLIWELDESKTKLPNLFNRNRTVLDFSPPVRISTRETSSAIMFFDILFSVQDPHSFARELKKLIIHKKQYEIVIRYWTKRVDGETKPQKLKIQGNFKVFYEEILDYWNNNGFKDLAEIAHIH